MFISQTTTRRTANKTYRSVRLVESRRVGRKVQQKTLLNLGANFAIPKVQWAELVEIIEARLAGNEFLFEPAPELTTTAEAIVQKLRSREMVQAADEALMGDTANVQLDSLEMDNGRSVGCERLALEARESLRFSEALKNVGMSDRDARLTMAMVIARMVHPSSERAALNWLETNSATLELLRLDTGKGLKLDKLYRLSDVLVKHHRTIEDALFARQPQGVPMLGVISGFDPFTGNLRFCWLSVAHTVMQVSWTSGQTYSRALRTDFIPAMCPCALLVLMSAYAGTG